MSDSGVIEKKISLSNNVFQANPNSDPANKLDDLDPPAYFIFIVQTYE